MTTLVCISCGETYSTRHMRAERDEATCACGGRRVLPSHAKPRKRLSRHRPMKRTQPKRDWTDARAKVDEEGCCRICKRTNRPLEAAHVLGREHDEPKLGKDGWPLKELYVAPNRVIPACGPFPEGCHGDVDFRRISLLPYLTLEEQLQAVKDAGSIEAARIRLAPVENREEVERSAHSEAPERSVA